jgi:hypothetical protein
MVLSKCGADEWCANAPKEAAETRRPIRLFLSKYLNLRINLTYIYRPNGKAYYF